MYPPGTHTAAASGGACVLVLVGLELLLDFCGCFFVRSVDRLREVQPALLLVPAALALLLGEAVGICRAASQGTGEEECFPPRTPEGLHALGRLECDLVGSVVCLAGGLGTRSR